MSGSDLLNNTGSFLQEAWGGVSGFIQNSDPAIKTTVGIIGAGLMAMTALQIANPIIDNTGMTGNPAMLAKFLAIPAALFGAATLMEAFTSGEDLGTAMNNVFHSVQSFLGANTEFIPVEAEAPVAADARGPAIPEGTEMHFGPR